MSKGLRERRTSLQSFLFPRELSQKECETNSARYTVYVYENVVKIAWNLENYICCRLAKKHLQ